jgi:ABC-type phosphate/phosphonate transport system substrate-binding protein
MEQPIVIGAVAYDARVVPIWEGMRDYFREAGLPIDYVLFSNYESQVGALLREHIHIAWNTNLAWVKVHQCTGGQCQALAMRDVDANFTTVFAARIDRGISSLKELRGKVIALGSADSAQAAILPVHYLQQAGIHAPADCTFRRFDSDVGKHGDTGRSELEVLQAIQEGSADAGALAEATWRTQRERGQVDGEHIQVIWTSPGYCHCNFSALATFPEALGSRWADTLCAMDHDNLRWRDLMDKEGVKQWIRADAEIMAGYQVLFDAIDRQS